MLCARALVRALNDAKNRAQQGCAMQFTGITLRGYKKFFDRTIDKQLRGVGNASRISADQCYFMAQSVDLHYFSSNQDPRHTKCSLE